MVTPMNGRSKVEAGLTHLRRRVLLSKKKQVVEQDVTSKNKKPPKPAWVEGITKKVILKKENSYSGRGRVAM